MTTQVKTSVIADGSITTAKFDPAAKCPSATAADSATTATTATTANGVAALSVGTAGLAASAVTPAKIAQPFTQGTAVNTTAGTSIDFTGIPSWVKRITVMFNGVSKNSVGALLVQVGTSSGIESTGYSSTGTNFTGSVVSTAGFIVADGNATWLTIGAMTLVNMGSNLWICTHSCSLGSVSATFLLGSGSKTLSAVLDRVRITTSTGTDTFDAGSVNILYE